MYRETTLKNNVIVLCLPFVHHTELQNFLIALVHASLPNVAAANRWHTRHTVASVCMSDDGKTVFSKRSAWSNEIISGWDTKTQAVLVSVLAVVYTVY